MQKCKYCNLILLLLFISVNTKSQILIGVETGLTQNHLFTNIGNRSFTNNENKNGYHFGCYLQYNVNKWLSFATNPNFSQKKYAFKRNGIFEGVYSEFNNNYVQLPFLAKIILGNKKIKGFASSGIYIGYWIYGNIKGNVPNIFNVRSSANTNGLITQNFILSSYNEKYIFNSIQDRRIEIGTAFSCGVSYKIKKYILTTEIFYYPAFTSQLKESIINQIPQYNHTYIFSTGVLYSFK